MFFNTEVTRGIHTKYCNLQHFKWLISHVPPTPTNNTDQIQSRVKKTSKGPKNCYYGTKGNGVPQGLFLGPVLFSLIWNEFKVFLSSDMWLSFLLSWQCGLDSASDSELAEVKRSFLTSGSVRPIGGGPIIFSLVQRYSRVAAMTTQAANGKQYTVLFLLTGEM